MRLDVLDRGHTFGKKALFVMIRLITRHPAPDVVKTLRYRPDFFGGPMGKVFQEVMRGSSEWSIGDRGYAITTNVWWLIATRRPSSPHSSRVSRQ